jgi:hypothetical protein
MPDCAFRRHLQKLTVGPRRAGRYFSTKSNERLCIGQTAGHYGRHIPQGPIDSRNGADDDHDR